MRKLILPKIYSGRAFLTALLLLSIPPAGLLSASAGHEVPELAKDLNPAPRADYRKQTPGISDSQQLSIEGTVTNQETGETLPGVNIVEKGTNNGTVSDVDGKFTIYVDGNATLVFSSIGYATQEVAVSARTTIDITLVPDVRSLEEVVVVGYGTQKKVNLTGSISTIEKSALEVSPVGNVTQALQGSIPGVTVTNSNLPGSESKIRIRGLGTINNNNPLWVVDGVPRTDGLNQINPTEVQSITVLKDAASTAIYGARGANGVILVTTVQGNKSTLPQVSVHGRVGAAHNTSRYDLLNIQEYGEMLWLQASNSGVPPTHPYYGNGIEPQTPRYLLPAGADNVDLSLYDITSYPITEANVAGTDWHDEIFNPGVIQDYNVSVSGGSENTTYSFIGGVLSEEGIVKLTGFKRYSLGTNVNSKINQWLTLGQSIRLGYTNDFGHQSDGENGAMGIIPQLTPLMPVYDVMGNYAPLSRLTGFDPLNNPIGDIERGQDFTREDYILNGNAHATVSFLKNFSFKTLFGYYIGKGHAKSPLEANPDSYQARADHQLTESSSEDKQWNFYNTLNFSETFNGVHNLEVLLGTEAINSESHNFSATRTKYFLTNEDYWVLDSGEGVQTNSGSAGDWSTFSYFGRIHYGYKGRYLVDAVFRRDGSSRFGKLNRYGSFPAFAFGWMASEENFMNATESFMDFLKVRFSWGQSGNDQVGNYNGFTTYRTDPSYSYYPVTGTNNGFTSGFESLAFGNPNAKWETTTSVNLGIDATFFNRFDLTIDVWQRHTSDMLYPKGIPAVNGQASVPSINIGDMKNKGIDIALNVHGSSQKDFRYNVTFNLSHYRNEIEKLSDVAEEAIIGSDYRGHIYTRSEVGTSFPQLFGYQVVGIFQTDEEVTSYPAFESYNAPGHFKFKDVNENGIIDDDDRTYIGNPHPDFTSGFTANIQYKQFDLTASLYASVGNDIVNAMRRYTDFNMFQRNRSKRRLYESWGSPYLESNADATMPIAELNDVMSMLPSSYFVEDGSFLRLQSLQVGYNLPKSLLDNISVKNVRIYVMATNLFTITNYTGLDPQIQTSDRAFGIDFGIWPTPKRYLMGFKIDL